jgi:L-malate glycosyltransferase
MGPLYTMPPLIKVVFLTNHMSLGGAERQIFYLVQGLDKQKFQSTLLTLYDVPQTAVLDNAVEIECLSLSSRKTTASRAISFAAGVLRMYKRLRQLKPDVVHAFLPAACTIAIPAARLAGVPLIIASRRSLTEVYRANNPLGAFLDKIVSRKAHVVVGNCEAVREEAVNIDKVPLNRTRVIYNGVDCEVFVTGRADHLRKSLGISKESPVIGMVANFYEYKRHCDFLEAAFQIREEFPNATFLLIGKDYGSLTSARELISRLGLESCVKIFESVQEPEEFYKAMDICVSSSSTEGFSNVILEAMACGKPTVATSVGGSKELIIHGESGLLVPPLSHSLLAKAVCSLLRNREMQESFGAKARVRALNDFSIRRMITEHERLYDKPRRVGSSACRL